jgi:hypothetical protein
MMRIIGTFGYAGVMACCLPFMLEPSMRTQFEHGTWYKKIKKNLQSKGVSSQAYLDFKLMQ